MLEDFFIASQEAAASGLEGSYLPFLVGLSFIIAVLGSYTGLSIAGGIQQAARKELRNILHAGSALALGSGIWAMHFIGMLAYDLKLPITYNPVLTFFSMMIAILFAGFVIGFVRQPRFTKSYLAIASVLLGLAICSMHYIGMAALKMDASIQYAPGLFLLSLLIAVGASAAALAITFYFSRVTGKNNISALRFLAALILGLGVCGMHYVGMAAANFLPYAICRPAASLDAAIDSQTLAFFITLIAGLIFVMALAISIYNQEQTALADKGKRDKFPARLISLAVGITLCALVILGAFNIDSTHRLKREKLSDSAKAQLATDYIFLDRKMASALYFFAMTGDPQFSEKYFASFYEQQARFAQFKKEFSLYLANFSDFDRIEESRARIDREVLRLAANRNQQDAVRLITSAEYQNIRNAFDQQFRDLIDLSLRLSQGKDELLERRDVLTFFLTLISVIALGIVWFFCFRSIRRWQVEISESRDNLTERIAEKEMLEKQMVLYVEEAKRSRDRALEAMRQADRANEAKTEFLTNMSHELRTPMNSILGLTEILLNNEKIQPEQKELLSVILEAGETLLKILNDILDLAKIEAQGLVLDKKDFALKAMLGNVVKTLKPMAEGKNIALIERLPDEDVIIFGDEVRLARIFTNLLGNAIKYTDEGNVTLLVQAEKHIRRGYITLFAEIKDTGIGIDEAKLELIFQKFSQADNSTTRKYGGTGLGLSITRELVNTMKGKIGVESKLGEGSRFWIEIPVEISSKQEDADTEAPKRSDETLETSDKAGLIPLKEARVIVAEDHPLNRVFMETFFREMGFEHVALAENGLEVLEIVKSQTVDVIFMDCHMPELNGYETTKAIRELEKETGMHKPIIAMTAKAMVGDREYCLASGMDDYISKPVDMQSLRRILRRWIDMN